MNNKCGLTKIFTSGSAKLYLLLLLFYFSATRLQAQVDEQVLEQFYNSDYRAPELNLSSASRLKSLFNYYSKQNIGEGKLDKNEYEEFVYRSNFFLEKLNKSGQVFYNDTISRYLNSLKNILLKDHPKRDIISVYLTRHPSFNAFTNDFGKIYVNIASISKLQNETELLALLAHEISHILNRHTHKFEEFRKTMEGDGWRDQRENRVLIRHVFSREQEYEADMNGFKLLANAGIDLNKAANIFDKLRFDLDPNLQGSSDYSLLTAGSPFLIEFLNSTQKNSNQEFKNIKEYESDSLLTHPLSAKRKAEILKYLELNNTPGTYIETGHFEYIHQVADFVLINTYIENGWFIECLDHVLKLRKQMPKNLYLVKSQAKLLLLITQDKYDATPFSQFINDKGSAYEDSSFLAFKEMFLMMNSMDMNVMSLLIVEKLEKDYNIPYLQRIHSYLVQFLYKYNENLFSNKGGQIALKSYEKLDSNTIHVNDQELELNLNLAQIKRYKKLLEKENFVPVTMRNAHSSLAITSHFLKSYSLTVSDLESIENYKLQRNRFENMLTLDEVLITTNPKEAIKYYKSGKYNKTKNLKTLNNVALVQSSNLFLKESYRSYILNYKKSMDLEVKMLPVLSSFSLIDRNYSNVAVSEITMESINYHYYLMIWINERFTYNDLIYSLVDEQITEFRKNKKVDFLLYNINARAVKNKLSRKHVTFGYNIFFDLNSEGITFISKVASKEKGNYQIFKQLFYLTEYNIKK
jgi:Zn-dependent protease with chaperone function